MNKYVFGYPELFLIIGIPARSKEQAIVMLGLVVTNPKLWEYVGVDSNVDADNVVSLRYKNNPGRLYQCSCNSKLFYTAVYGNYHCVVCGNVVPKLINEGELIEGRSN